MNFTKQYRKNRQRCQENEFYSVVWQLLLYFYKEFPSKILSVYVFVKKTSRNLCVCACMPTWKNIYVKIYEIYFRKKLYNSNIFCIYFLRYIRQNIFDIYYSKPLEIYFHAKKLYMSHIYFIFMRVRVCVYPIFNVSNPNNSITAWDIDMKFCTPVTQW